MDLRPIPARDWADWYTGELCASFPACECNPRPGGGGAL